MGVSVPVNDVSAPTKALENLTVDGVTHARNISSQAEGFSHKDTRFLSKRNDIINPLIHAFYLSFGYHYPVQLGPDVVFNTVLQGVSEHVSRDPEKFRHTFVSHKDKKKLVVTFDSFEKGNWNNDWETCIEALGSQIFDNICGDEAKDILTTRFSTTTRTMATAHTAVFMDVVKHYFEYTLITSCGIPRVDIQGTREDWLLLARRLDAFLKKLKLSDWNREIQSILGHIIDAFDGKVDTNHWNGVFKYNGPLGSGRVATVSGWIGKLFLYTEAGMNPLVLQGHAEVDVGDFPHGLTSTPFQWNYLGVQYEMKMMSGLVGVSIENESVLKPELGWVIASHEDQSCKTGANKSGSVTFLNCLGLG